MKIKNIWVATTQLMNVHFKVFIPTLTFPNQCLQDVTHRAAVATITQPSSWAHGKFSRWSTGIVFWLGFQGLGKNSYLPREKEQKKQVLKVARLKKNMEAFFLLHQNIPPKLCWSEKKCFPSHERPVKTAGWFGTCGLPGRVSYDFCSTRHRSKKTVYQVTCLHIQMDHPHNSQCLSSWWACIRWYISPKSCIVIIRSHKQLGVG